MVAVVVVVVEMMTVVVSVVTSVSEPRHKTGRLMDHEVTLGETLPGALMGRITTCSDRSQDKNLYDSALLYPLLLATTLPPPIPPSDTLSPHIVKEQQ